MVNYFSMKKNKLINKFLGFNYYVLVILLLIGFSIVYFSYHRTKNQEEIYVSVNISNPGSNNNWVSNWIANAIDVGDKEMTSLGNVIVQVVDKEEYEAGSNSKNVFLLLKTKIGKDRSGT